MKPNGHQLPKNNMKNITITTKELEEEIKKTLENDICSTQALDVAADRTRVKKELMKMFQRIYWNKLIKTNKKTYEQPRKSKKSAKRN